MERLFVKDMPDDIKLLTLKKEISDMHLLVDTDLVLKASSMIDTYNITEEIGKFLYKVDSILTKESTRKNRLSTILYGLRIFEVYSHIFEKYSVESIITLIFYNLFDDDVLGCFQECLRKYNDSFLQLITNRNNSISGRIDDLTVVDTLYRKLFNDELPENFLEKEDRNIVISSLYNDLNKEQLQELYYDISNSCLNDNEICNNFEKIKNMEENKNEN